MLKRALIALVPIIISRVLRARQTRTGRGAPQSRPRR